jgi:hypothetical protein
LGPKASLGLADQPALMMQMKLPDKTGFSLETYRLVAVRSREKRDFPPVSRDLSTFSRHEGFSILRDLFAYRYPPLGVIYLHGRRPVLRVSCPREPSAQLSSLAGV